MKKNADVVPIQSLKQDPNNARNHGPENMDAIAASLKKFGPARSIVIDRDGIVRAGNGTLEAARLAGVNNVRIIEADGKTLIAVKRSDLHGQEAAGYAIADNRSGELAEWDFDVLGEVLADLKSSEDPELLQSLGFSLEQLQTLIPSSDTDTRTEPPIPKAPEKPVTKRGDIWKFGPHRLLCGDSTSKKEADRLLHGIESQLLHADPPYGMGKEKDGIEGDNQYGEELDRFQMSWWTMLREYLTDNASVYIWGNPEPLWRLWHLHLIKSEELAYRNEIVWDKGPGFGQRSHLQRSFSINTERCLFFMRGRQFFGNVNKDDFFEGFEPLRVFFEEQFAIMDWGPADVLRLCGVGMYGHWCTRSQWTLVPSKHYATLQEAAKGRAFVRPYREIRKEYDRARKGGGHLDPIRSFNETRAYFENTHDNMNEVWTFPRVETEERYEHATPKPVQIVERIIRSSCEAGKMFVDPFMGSGSSLIAAEKAGRVCYGIEIAERYCDVICQRWANFTEESPIRESDGARFLDLKG